MSPIKFFLFTSALLGVFASIQASEKPSEAWLKLSIHSQNVGQRIHMLGVDADRPDPKKFEKDIQAIDTILDEMVDKGILKRAQFELKPELQIEESLVTAVSELIHKYAPQYGIFVIREMMDIGVKKSLTEPKDDTPLLLNVRMPEDFLKEFKALLNKSGFEK